MLFLVPSRFLADVGGFIPFKEVEGCPDWAQYPGAHVPGKKLNNQDPGNYWLPDPHPYSEGQIWPEGEAIEGLPDWVTPAPAAISARFVAVL